jgi:PIN domain nuclease of toxin-antitoxin system
MVPVAPRGGQPAPFLSAPLNHRTPFDRMLIARGQVDDVTPVTRDSEVPEYDVDVLAG